MGTTASILSHELNHPLTATANSVRGSRRMLAAVEGCDDVCAAPDEADRSTVRAGEIVRRVRELVTKDDIERQSIDLTPLIEEARAMPMIDVRSAGIVHRLDLDFAAGAVKVDH